MPLQYSSSSRFWSPAKILLMLQVVVAMNLSINHASSVNRFDNETDQLALLEFKNQIYSDPLGVLNSWNHTQHHCQWEGVKCGKRRQRVTALNLTGKSLSGTISPHVGNLSFMKFINLRENQFHGEIPQEVGRLFRLEYLDLIGNTLSGQIPVNLSQCSQITVIYLSFNRLEGRITIEPSNLKKLEKLYLHSNNLTGEIPSAIGNLSSLVELNLSHNKLEGNLPEEMGLLTRLTKLGVSVNKLSGTIPASIYNITAMVLISAAANFFHGNLPTNLGLTLPNLQALGIAGNEFSGHIPISVTNASALEVLDLPNNKLEGQVPANLGVLLKLQRVSVFGNLLGSSSTGDLGFIATLTNSTNLKILLLHMNNFGGEIPKAVVNLSHQLTEFDISGNKLSGTIPEGFGSFDKLYYLNAALNSLSGVMPSDFGEFKNMQYLDLDGNRLSGPILSTVCNVTSLYHLDLSSNRFAGNDIFSNVLVNCQNLQYLDISQNNISGVVTPHFFGMHSSLNFLSLGRNIFSGSLPLEVGMLIHLEVFNVSYNKFSGEIPLPLVNCLDLKYIDMQFNFFEGIIPPNLASLKGIQQLDLSSNNLTGRIPRDLEKLQYLRYLNLSYNDLDGEVPSTGIFKNASQISLAGNKKLCGGIPELNFPSCPMKKGKNKRKLNAAVMLSTVLPATVLVLGALLFYFVIYQKRNTRTVGLSMVPTKADKHLRVSYHELHRATSGFSPEKMIGSGSFGAVYKGRLDQHRDRLVAIKVLNLQRNGASKSFKAECKVLRNIRHRNLVSILGYCSSIDSKGQEFKALIYEFMENENLDLWLHPGEKTDQTITSRKLDLFQRLNIAIDVASALHYLHNHIETTIVHCDIKPSNILLDNDFVAHVGDFGLARLLPKTINTILEQGTSSSLSIRGSIGYAAPEYGMGLQVSTHGDVYAYGILLLEMFTAKRPTDDTFMDALDLHNYVKRALSEHVCLIVDPMLLSNGDDNGKGTAPVELYNDEKRIQSLTSVLKIGIKCSAALPNDRMPMNEVVRKLHLIKDGFLGAKINTADLDI